MPHLAAFPPSPEQGLRHAADQTAERWNALSGDAQFVIGNMAVLAADAAVVMTTHETWNDAAPALVGAAAIVMGGRYAVKMVTDRLGNWWPGK